MPPEYESAKETKKLGDISIERTVDGRILKINNTEVGNNDAIVILQRHQKPASFPKEELLASASGRENPENLDYVYNPKSTKAGAEQEEVLLQKVETAFGNMDHIATTPRQRGEDHAQLIQKQFPTAKYEESISEALDDSGLGLLGESQYGAEKYSVQETQKLFGGTGNSKAHFGKGKDPEARKSLTYMQSWVQHGHLPEGNPWQVENPEGAL